MLETAVQTRSRPTFTLRQLLAIDGVTCVVAGVLLALAATPLAELFALPQALLFYAGLVLFPCAALMFFTARMQTPAPALVWLVITGNAAWALGSVLVALLWFAPTAIGVAILLAQAVVVAGLGVMELLVVPSGESRHH
jgi:hypothetical protein